VIRDKNGDFEIGDPPMQSMDEQEEGGPEDAREDESALRLSFAGEYKILTACRGETEIGRCGEASSEG
jgi:hypothetical protein